MRTETEDLLDSLKFSYIQYKSSVKENNIVNIAYTQGYSIALEDILVYFGITNITKEEVRKDFLEDIPLIRRNPLDFVKIVKM